MFHVDLSCTRSIDLNLLILGLKVGQIFFGSNDLTFRLQLAAMKQLLIEEFRISSNFTWGEVHSSFPINIGNVDCFLIFLR